MIAFFRHFFRILGVSALLWGGLPLPAAGAGAEHGGVVNINTADAETLAARLLGVGRARAEAIVAWRERNGQFSSLRQLDEVKGFGPGLIERNRDRIVFHD